MISFEFMIEMILKVRSTIHPSLKRHQLFKGTLLATFGAGLLLVSGIWVPEPLLNQWGYVLVALAFALMTWGLLPYRRLCRLEIKPDELVISENQALHFFSAGKLRLTVPLESIEKITYLESQKTYGIGLWIKHPAPKKVIFYQKWFKAL